MLFRSGIERAVERVLHQIVGQPDQIDQLQQAAVQILRALGFGGGIVDPVAFGIGGQVAG